jgi:hypothetical protein
LDAGLRPRVIILTLDTTDQIFESRIVTQSIELWFDSNHCKVYDCVPINPGGYLLSRT